MSGPALFAVVRGEPTAEELAALTTVLSQVMARQQAARAPGPASPGGWADRSRLLRTPLAPGPGAWRRSAALPGS